MITPETALKLPYARMLHRTEHFSALEGYQRLVLMGACALTGGQQEQRYLQAISDLKREDVERLTDTFGQLVIDMTGRPLEDLLGPVYMALAGTHNSKYCGEVYTPPEVASLMSTLVRLGAPASTSPGEPLTCMEPSCGSGGLILASTRDLESSGRDRRTVRWVAQDLQPTAAYAAYINLTLSGVPAVVRCGDTIRGTLTWSWTNWHWASARPYTAGRASKGADARPPA